MTTAAGQGTALAGGRFTQVLLQPLAMESSLEV